PTGRQRFKRRSSSSIPRSRRTCRRCRTDAEQPNARRKPRRNGFKARLRRGPVSEARRIPAARPIKPRGRWQRIHGHPPRKTWRRRRLGCTQRRGERDMRMSQKCSLRVLCGIALIGVAWMASRPMRAEDVKSQTLVYAAYEGEDTAGSVFKTMKANQKATGEHIESYAVVSKDL